MVLCMWARFSLSVMSNSLWPMDCNGWKRNGWIGFTSCDKPGQSDEAAWEAMLRSANTCVRFIWKNCDWLVMSAMDAALESGDSSVTHLPFLDWVIFPSWFSIGEWIERSLYRLELEEQLVMAWSSVKSWGGTNLFSKPQKSVFLTEKLNGWLTFITSFLLPTP